ncbi:MAG: TIGR02996 domain-containing protein [Myxococcota bacterium]
MSYDFSGIRADLAADGPREVYADWLEEHGQPERAEYIHLAVRLARRHPADADRNDLAKRVFALEKKHARAWTADLREHVMFATFDRGLVEQARITPKKLVSHAPRIFELAPVLHRVWSRDPLPRALVPELAARPELRWLDSLALNEQRLGPPGVRSLLESPHLTGLRELSLRDDRVDDEAGGALASWPGLTALTSLSLGQNPIGPAVLAQVLANAPALTRLSASGLPLQLLPDSLRHAGLEHLDASWCTFDPGDWARLATQFPGIRSLAFENRPLERGHAAAIARVPWALTHLRMYQARFDDAAFTELLSGPWAALESFRAYANQLGDAGWAALGAHPWPRLREVFLDGLPSVAAGRSLHALAPRLESLTLWGTTGTDALNALLEVPWPRLHTLCVTASEATVPALANREHLPVLRSLDLRRSKITGPNLRILRREYGFGLR